MKRVLIADNQYITRKGVSAVLAEKEDCVIRHVWAKKELIDFLKDFPDSLVVLDYTLFDFRSIDELFILNTRFPNVQWMLFSAELSTDFLRQVYFNTPNFSIIYKDSNENEITTGFSDFLNGRRFVCSIVSNALLNNLYKQNTEKQKANLTSTEQEILKDIAGGKTTKEIAESRHISTHTVVSHRKNIFRKIDVNNIHEATKYAVKAGLVDLSDYFI
jgi:DNA-binding NarL/FixJ family response regulator